MTSQAPGYPAYPTDPVVEQRTSVMAVFSLVCSLICCPPGPAVIGIGLGIVALMAINRSEGRLVGKGLAMSGIVLGLVFTAIWIGAAVGGSRVWAEYQKLVAPLTTSLVASDKGDFSKLKPLLATQVTQKLTDADFETFRTGYQSELGNFIGTSDSLMDVIKGAMAQTAGADQLRGHNDILPFVANFDKGSTLVVFQFDPATSNIKDRKFTNIQVIAPSGRMWLLYDPQRISGKTSTQISPPDVKPPDVKPDVKPDSKPEDKPVPPPPPPGPGSG